MTTLLSGAEAAELVQPGERLGDVEVVRIETHPEYRRYFLRYADGTVLPAEIGFRDAQHPGLCPHGELTVYPRPDLAEGPVPAGWSVPMDTLCARLASTPEPPLSRAVADAQTGKGSGAGTGEGNTVSYRALYADTLVWVLVRLLVLLGVVWTTMAAVNAGRRRVFGEGIAWFGMAFLVRILVSPVGLFNGGNAGYEKLLLALGAERSPYGPGFPAIYALFGVDHPDEVFTLNRLFNSLAAPLLFGLVRRHDGLFAARVAALGLVLLPVHVRISASELMHGPLLTLSLAAVLGLELARGEPAGGRAGWMRSLIQGFGGRSFGGLLAGAAGGLAVLIRPDAAVLLPVMVLFVGLGVRRRGPGEPWARWFWQARADGVWCVVGVAIVAVAFGLRPPMDIAGQQVLRLDLLTGAGVLHVLLPRVSLGDDAMSQLVLVLDQSPPWVPLFALFGLLGRGRWPPLVWITFFTLPFVLKSWPGADLLRLQLAAQAGWLWMAGRGVGWLAGALMAFGRQTGKGGDWRWKVYAIWALGLLPWLPTATTRWAKHEEWRFLSATVPDLADETVVYYDAETARAGKLALVMEHLGPARWRPLADLVPADPVLQPLVLQPLVLRGVDCYASPDGACAQLFSRCSADPERVTTLRGEADRDLKLPPSFEIGLYRLSCP